jgi:hypothetical protein
LAEGAEGGKKKSLQWLQDELGHAPLPQVLEYVEWSDEAVRAEARDD